MSSVQGPVICPATVHAKQTRAYKLPINGPLMKNRVLRSGFWGFKGFNGSRINVGNQPRFQKGKAVKCSFSSSSNGNGSTAENFNENDADYVNSSVVEAGEFLIVHEYAIFFRTESHMCSYTEITLNLYFISFSGLYQLWIIYSVLLLWRNGNNLILWMTNLWNLYVVLKWI